MIFVGVKSAPLSWKPGPALRPPLLLASSSCEAACRVQLVSHRRQQAGLGATPGLEQPLRTEGVNSGKGLVVVDNRQLGELCAREGQCVNQGLELRVRLVLEAAQRGVRLVGAALLLAGSRVRAGATLTQGADAASAQRGAPC